MDNPVAPVVGGADAEGMTAQRDPYVKVYYRIVDDEKFETVYDDDAALALWLRLLILADGMYPAPAPLPRVKRKALAKLVAAGLIDEVPGDRFRIHGMAAERGARRKQAQDAARKRWENGRNASA